VLDTQTNNEARNDSHRTAASPRLSVLTDRRLVAELLGAAFTLVSRCSPDGPGSIPYGFLAESNVVIIDATIGPEDPAVAALCFQAARQGIPVVVFGDCKMRVTKGAWLERGVAAFVDDHDGLAVVREILERLSQGQSVLGVSIRESLLSELRVHRSRTQERFTAFESLTKREEDVLRQLSLGLSPEDVARASYVSLNTIRTQIRGILAKLDVTSVVAAVALAYRTGWLEADLAS
jgi:two-component system, NarL family, nitrate/nitrite response regulator NarL